MLIFTLRKLNLFIFTMLLLTLLSFSLSFLFPGDQLINLTGQLNATDEMRLTLAQEYDHSSSVFWQYLAYLGHILNGELGLSMTNQANIANEILRLLPATIELSLFAFVLATVIGIPLGFIAAIRHHKPTDHAILAFAMIGYSIPVFWLGLLAILTFSIQLGWLPSGGQISLLYEIERTTGFMLIDILLSNSPYKWQALQNNFAHMILPALVIAAAPATVFIRLARTAMLEVLQTSYIKATRAKGLSFSQIIFRHAIRNALIKVIQHIGLQFANLVTLAMITEVIFNWPGIGRWLIESIYQRDYTAIQSGLLVLSSFIFLVHIITDYTYAALNPLARGAKYGSR
ncbi:ABC transporter permease subunit [Thalassotalea euphylliae]|uniref:ABC transporter permease subunit n=1 Tax=Thalassotalea euphylliae TaxID=1655234 RepID=A0A3E0TSY8_9GAMM|nr:ABC transporter permease subunit [Thalassotalea euphylliae]REL27593.1 ABC transporter permease subunit [Thalassotalea euphylliae]